MRNWYDVLNLRVSNLHLKRGGKVTMESSGVTLPLAGNVYGLAKIGRQGAPVAKTTSVTLTGAEMLAGILTGNQGAGAGAAYTLPLGADMEKAFRLVKGELAVDDSFDLFVINLSVTAAEDITMTTNTGWTLVGSMLVIEQAAGNPGGSNGHFRARRTAADTYTLYRIA